MFKFSFNVYCKYFIFGTILPWSIEFCAIFVCCSVCLLAHAYMVYVLVMQTQETITITCVFIPLLNVCSVILFEKIVLQICTQVDALSEFKAITCLQIACALFIRIPSQVHIRFVIYSLVAGDG